VIVYKLTNKINGKEYIGITSKTLDERVNGHLCRCGKGKIHYAIHNAIMKYGIDNFDKSILFTGTSWKELQDVERALIAKHNTFAPKGYNLTYGGDGMLGFKHSEETCAKIGEFNRNRSVSEETREKLRVANTGKKMPREGVEKSAKARLGQKRTIAMKNRISIGRIGKGLLNRAAASLCSSDVAIIKGLLNCGKSQADISEIFEIDQSSVSRIKTGYRWWDIAPASISQIVGWGVYHT